ncbi:hypothetical protein V6N13_013941 [Hibiscus sabdariffa]
MGGIGKTTLARVVYDQMSSHFEGKCFIADVREVSDKFGLVSLQKQLLFQILSGEVFEFFNVHDGSAILSHRLSHKRVLVVIDDVDNLQHLKCLVGRHDWFGLGSRIIITTRDEHLLRSYQVDDVYVSKTLNPEDASHLFNLKAFGSEIVAKDDLIKLSKHVVRYAGGLPLALEVLGSFFCGRDAAQWRSAIKRLEKDSNKEILERLRISFDGLEETEKNIFLDIACFFNGRRKTFRIEQLWKENIPLHKLKVLNIKRSKNLIKTPDFTTAPNLEILISEGCIRIVDVHPSIGVLSRLKILNLRSCKSLRNLPIKIGIVSLETLILKDCRNLISLPSSIGGCKILKTLDLSGCFKVDTLPENLQQVELLEELDLSETAIAEPPSFIFQLKSLKVLSLNRLKGPSSSSKLASNLPSLFQIFQRGRMESVPLMLHSLSGLSFLRDLKLRHCNLCEGDIPSDISCLSFLEKLDLGGNNFISAPVFVSGLSRLQYLGLSNCRELKSFADLGATLEVFATPSKVFNAVDWTQFNGLHCYRLVENINAFTMLKTHLKNDSRWIGVAFCCIFVNDDASRDEELTCEAVIHHRNSGQGSSDESVFRGRNPRHVTGAGWIFSKEYNQPILNDHIYLCYLSCDRLYPLSLEDKRGESETENLSISDCSNLDFDELQFSIASSECHKSVRVKKCGLEELYSKIEIEEDDIRIIEICGMGDIGKTTLARVVYDQMSSHFEWNAIISHRLSHKKALVVIDDVDNLQHLKCLVGRHDWYGLGNRIIVTARDEHLLQSYRVDDVYKPSTLNDDYALELFNLKAFDSEIVPNNAFIKLSEHVVKYASGLPSALEVLGSFLCGRTVDQWKSEIQRLENDANKEIIERFRISFDGLEETEKNIFLDIACFFNGEEKDFIIKVLDCCEFFPDIGIDVLFKKSLLTVDKNNTLWVHNLLQETGRKIVQEKSSEELGKRCRLWEEKDVYRVLTENIVSHST